MTLPTPSGKLASVIGNMAIKSHRRQPDLTGGLNTRSRYPEF